MARRPLPAHRARVLMATPGGRRGSAARAIDDPWAAIAIFIGAFTPEECANYFTNSGYEPD